MLPRSTKRSNFFLLFFLQNYREEEFEIAIIYVEKIIFEMAEI